jgi:hypothetical protein
MGVTITELNNNATVTSAPIIFKLKTDVADEIYKDISGLPYSAISPGDLITYLTFQINLNPINTQATINSIIYDSGLDEYHISITPNEEGTVLLSFTPDGTLYEDAGGVSWLGMTSSDSSVTYDVPSLTCSVESSLPFGTLYVKNGVTYTVTFTFNTQPHDSSFADNLLDAGEFQAGLTYSGVDIVTTNMPTPGIYVVTVTTNFASEGDLLIVALDNNLLAFNAGGDPYIPPPSPGLISEYTGDNYGPQVGGIDHPSLYTPIISDNTSSSLKITWSKTQDFHLANTVYYRIRRALNVGFTSGVTTIKDWDIESNFLQDGNDLYYTDTGLSASTTYYYKVDTRDNSYHTDSAQVGNVHTFQTAFGTTSSAVDVTSPTVGTPTLSTASITSSGLTLNWTAATDNITSQANLQYLAYYSLSNNLSSVANIEANGTPVGSYTSNIITKNVTGLLSGTTYYFNVIVKDEANNKATYTTFQQATAFVSVIDETNSVVDEPTTWGDGSDLDLTVPAVVESGTLTLNVPSIDSITGSGSITVNPGASISINGPTGPRTMTVPSGKRYKLKP